ncbi:MAG: nitroreductase [Proteobacteria bacterium]|nr:nitroreductase [Pseudomonadota bacterium]
MSISALEDNNPSQNRQDDFTQLVTTRRSVRAFLPDPVDPELLSKLFTLATSAPSNCNSQPWLTHVVSGASRDAMREALMRTIGEGEFVLDFPYDGKYTGVYRERQLDVGLMLYKALGVTREDKAGKRQAFLRNLEFFDAPHAAFIFMPDWAGIREAADVGMYAQNLMLSMRAYGISSCPQTILGYNADVVRKQLEIDSSQKLLFGISFGYADETRPENQICPARATLSEVTKFYV